jgi:hypothetical protein
MFRWTNQPRRVGVKSAGKIARVVAAVVLSLAVSLPASALSRDVPRRDDPNSQAYQLRSERRHDNLRGPLPVHRKTHTGGHGLI